MTQVGINRAACCECERLGLGGSAAFAGMRVAGLSVQHMCAECPRPGAHHIALPHPSAAVPSSATTVAAKQHAGEAPLYQDDDFCPLAGAAPARVHSGGWAGATV